jgi:hypothetical protein
MYEVREMAALWLGLALAATLLSIRRRAVPRHHREVNGE